MAGVIISPIRENSTNKFPAASANKAGLPWWLPGGIALTVIAALTLLPLTAMLLEAGDIDWHTVLADTYTERIIRFSLEQALLSTVLSMALALPVALALAHTPSFRGRNLIVTLFSLSLVIPTIVAIYGIVAVYGRTGWLSRLLGLADLEPLLFYGLPGILIAHVFLNMPLAARVMLTTLDSIPQTNWRLARQLGMQPLSLWRYIEWPALASLLPGLALLIFTLCFTSFAIVMTVGGGPRATTIEVAIYQALRFDFDISQALALACIQLVICLCLTLASTFFKTGTAIGFQSISQSKPQIQSGASDHYRLWSHPLHRLCNTLVIAIACVFVLAPLLAMLLSAINSRALAVITDDATVEAVLNTVLAALSSATMAVLLALALLISARHLSVRLEREHSSKWLQLAGNMILILPPVVLGTGLFLLLRPFADVFSVALLLVIMINSLMALPFALRILDVPLMRVARENDKLIVSLGVRGIARWRHIDMPQLRQPIALAFAVSATLSAGDLSAIALFGSEQLSTLPLLLYQRMGSYRLDEAAVTAAILLLLCLALFAGSQRLIRGNANAIS